MCRSVPQMAAALTRIRISRSLTSGTGRSSAHTAPGAGSLLTMPRILVISPHPFLLPAMTAAILMASTMLPQRWRSLSQLFPNAVPWSTDVRIMGSPKVILTPLTDAHLPVAGRSEPATLIAMCPWSWYMATTASYWPPAFTKTVSGGNRPFYFQNLWPSRLRWPGMISLISSSPNKPPSPAWGLSPATAILGSGIPMSVRAEAVSVIVSKTLSRLQRSHALLRETWRGDVRYPEVTVHKHHGVALRPLYERRISQCGRGEDTRPR